MKKRWRKFNFLEWRSDPALSCCSREARSLWLDIVGLIYDAEDEGRLSIKGKAPTDKELAAILGDDPRVIRRLLDELKRADVYDISDGTFVKSRRIHREEVATEIGKKFGRSGGNPALKNRDEAEKGVNPLNQSPESRDQKPEKEEANASSKKRVASRLPDDWSPPASWTSWAIAFVDPDGRRLTASQVATEAAKFPDYWRSQPGSKSVKTDWQATWKNWVRTACERHGRVVASSGDDNGPGGQVFEAVVIDGKHVLRPRRAA